MAYNMISSNLIHAIENAYQDQKFTDGDVNDHPEWVADAIAWAEAQISTGTANDFVQSVMAARKTWGRLSVGQKRGLLNFIRNEVLSAEKAAQQIIDELTTGKVALDLRPLPSGKYAVLNANNDASFYDVSNIKDEKSKWNGWIFANIMSSDNKLRIGTQRPGQKYQGTHEDALVKIMQDPLSATMLYGRMIGVCGICGRTLTDPESIEQGIGPICIKQFKDDTEELLRQILHI
jgi:hypothetical protein